MKNKNLLKKITSTLLISTIALSTTSQIITFARSLDLQITESLVNHPEFLKIIIENFESENSEACKKLQEESESTSESSSDSDSECSEISKNNIITLLEELKMNSSLVDDLEKIISNKLNKSIKISSIAPHVFTRIKEKKDMSWCNLLDSITPKAILNFKIFNKENESTSKYKIDADNINVVKEICQAKSTEDNKTSNSYKYYVGNENSIPTGFETRISVTIPLKNMSEDENGETYKISIVLAPTKSEFQEEYRIITIHNKDSESIVENYNNLKYRLNSYNLYAYLNKEETYNGLQQLKSAVEIYNKEATSKFLNKNLDAYLKIYDILKSETLNSNQHGFIKEMQNKDKQALTNIAKINVDALKKSFEKHKGKPNTKNQKKELSPEEIQEQRRLKKANKQNKKQTKQTQIKEKTLTEQQT